MTQPGRRGRRRRYFGVSEAVRKQHGWLELIQTSGPFLTLPVAARVFPNGLPAVPAAYRATVRSQVAAMMGDGGASRHTVIHSLLADVLGWGDALLLDDDVPAALAEPVAEHGLTVRPTIAFAAPALTDDLDFGDPRVPDAGDGDDVPDLGSLAVVLTAAAEDVAAVADGESDDGEDGDTGDAEDPDELPYRLLGMLAPWGSHPLARTSQDGWTASPAERLAVLLRARDVPIGLVTDGRWWGLVWAPRGGTTGVAVWDAGVFAEEPDSLRAFVSLLGRARFLGVRPADRLPALLEESLGAAEQVTEALGRQVREAVELLIRTLDRLDADSDGALLAGVDDDELYAGAVTVMMRIVFLLFAEDRTLLPSDDDLYLAGYSIAALVEQLEQRAQLSGEQALEHRTGAWHRLLATSRALHGGVLHEDLRLPAYGGSLFDPAAHPWLEAADRVDDRTMLRMLRAVQYVELDGERRRLTFRALDVEQIGYVYEGLLELEVRTAEETVLGLSRSKDWPGGKEPAEIGLSQVEAWLAEAPPRLAERLAPRTGRKAGAIERYLARTLEEHQRSALLRATRGDADLAATIEPVALALHWYAGGTPAVTLPARRYVAPSTRRAATGTHYTPRSLAEEVAAGALEPLVYRPGPLETADRSRWQLRPSPFIETLKVADIAMGSGAFLVAACRYLADRLVEAWQSEGREDALRAQRAVESRGPGRLDADAEVERVVLDARRTIAERCLYGTDINPLAVEMAKLSLWLVTMDARRPFGFLDDRLVAGDSLLGLADVAQLETLHVDPVAGRKAATDELDYTGQWRSRLEQAADVRRQITASPVLTARDVEHKQRLLTQARTLTDHVAAIADAVTAVGLRTATVGSAKQVSAEFAALRMRVGLAGDEDTKAIAEAADRDLQASLPPGKERRRPLHWPVVFPEILVDPVDPGFDAIIGNPPFMSGQDVSGSNGSNYLGWLQRWDGKAVKGSADLSSRFVLRAERLLNDRGQLGVIANNTLVQGATLRVGLLQAVNRGLEIRAGKSSHPWPTSSANVEIVNVWASRAPIGTDGVRVLDGEDVPTIGADLEPVGRVAGRPFRLAENDGIAFQGSNILGLGFTMTPERAAELIRRDPRNAEALQPYVIGKDLTQRPDSSASRWVINFRDWPLERADTYPDLIDIVRRTVKPKRDRNKRPQRRDRWWLYAERAPELYQRIADLDQVLALSRVSNLVLPVRVPTGPVYAETAVVFALDEPTDLAVLSSSVHFCWVARYTSTMRTDIRYAPSDVFLTLARPTGTPELAVLGEQLDARRRELMLARSWGMTTTYNAVHSPAVRDREIVELREIHEAIDHAVLAAYGWSDLDPQVGHHPTKIGTRWTVSREARFELLDLLLEENHRRQAAEQDR